MDTKAPTKKEVTLTETELVAMEFTAFKSGVTVGKKIADAAFIEAKRLREERKTHPIPLLLPAPTDPTTPDPKRAA